VPAKSSRFDRDLAAVTTGSLAAGAWPPAWMHARLLAYVRARARGSREKKKPCGLPAAAAAVRARPGRPGKISREIGVGRGKRAAGSGGSSVHASGVGPGPISGFPEEDLVPP